jgi:hypothetical protein
MSRNSEIPIIDHSVNKQTWIEIYDKFSSVDKGMFNCLSLIEKEKVVINDIQKESKSHESRLREVEHNMRFFKEHIQILTNKVDMKQHSKKASSAKPTDVNAMENMIESHIMQNLEKFDKVLKNMMRYEHKVTDIDTRLTSLDTQVKESQSTRTEHFMTYEDQDIPSKPYNKNSSSDDSDRRHEEDSSISSALQHFKDSRPEMKQDYNVSPDMVKFIEMKQKGRNTACQPLIRESPINLTSQNNSQNTNKRKGSMPNASFNNKTTRNTKKSIPGHSNRHFSTERNHAGPQDYSSHNQTAISNFNYAQLGKVLQINKLYIGSQPNSRQSDPNTYSGQANMSSMSDPNPQFLEALQKRGLGRILKQV